MAGAAVAKVTGGSGGDPDGWGWWFGVAGGFRPAAPRPSPPGGGKGGPRAPSAGLPSGRAALRLRLRPQDVRPPAPSAAPLPAARWAAGTPPPPAREPAEVSAAGRREGAGTRGGRACSPFPVPIFGTGAHRQLLERPRARHFPCVGAGAPGRGEPAGRSCGGGARRAGGGAPCGGCAGLHPRGQASLRRPPPLPSSHTRPLPGPSPQPSGPDAAPGKVLQSNSRLFW